MPGQSGHALPDVALHRSGPESGLRVAHCHVCFGPQAGVPIHSKISPWLASKRAIILLGMDWHSSAN
jgi:hypothetical protein